MLQWLYTSISNVSFFGLILQVCQLFRSGRRQVDPQSPTCMQSAAREEGAHPCGVVGVVQHGLPRTSAIHGATMGVRTLIDLFYLWRRLYREPSPFRLRWRAPHFCYVSIYGKGPPSQGSISRLHEQEQTRCEK
jgi:hypothetical protein